MTDYGRCLAARAAIPSGSRFASSCQHRIAIAWRAWRGAAGDELIQLAGIAALLAYVMDNHGFSDPLPIAVFACLLLHGRYSDRAASAGEAGTAETGTGSVHEHAAPEGGDAQENLP